MSMYVMPELARLLVKERYEEALRAGDDRRYARPKPDGQRSPFHFNFFRPKAQTAPNCQPAACSC
jgi:hypothetical protein